MTGLFAISCPFPPLSERFKRVTAPRKKHNSQPQIVAANTSSKVLTKITKCDKISM